MQTAYQIVVASSRDVAAAGVGDLWDPGKTDGAASRARYDGKPLSPGGRYFWTVRTWDASGQSSGYARVQEFRTGLGPTLKGASTYPLVKTPVTARSVLRIDPTRLTFDFGKDAFGYLELEVPSGDPTRVTAHLGEKLAGRQVDRKPPESVRYKEIPVDLTPGRTFYELHPPPDRGNTLPGAIRTPPDFGVLMPFRYAELEGTKEAMKRVAVRQMTVHYPFDDGASSFKSSNDELNAVWELSKYSMKATSFTGYYVDGDRERIPYEADAFINQLSHYAVDREYAMARATLEYLLRHPTWPTEWQSHVLFIAWHDYLYTGSPRALEDGFDLLKARTLESREGPGGLVTSTPEQILHGDIVDWPEGERDGFVFTNVNSVVNAFYYRGLVTIADTARAIGKSVDAARYDARAKEVKDEFNRRFYNSWTKRYVDGEGTSHASLHANVFALAFGLVPDDRKDAVLTYVKARGMACSVYVAHYLLEALYANRQDEAAFALLTSQEKRSWNNMLRNGATITTEAWDQETKPNQDWNHAWGAAPANAISRWLVGVRPLDPGFANAAIEPQPSSLQWFDAVVPTIKGSIRIRYDRVDASAYKFALEVPGNMNAHFRLPSGTSIREVELDGKVITARHTADTISLPALGPGKHWISAR